MIIQYKSSNKILHIYSDESYLSEPRTPSRIGGHYYPSSIPTDPAKAPNLLPLLVDVFGIKYERQEEITHLLDVPKAIYNISE